MSEKDGGPAFPTTYGIGMNYGQSLRDYFAAQAMGSLISDSDCSEWTYADVAEAAYAYADAMLVERAQ